MRRWNIWSISRTHETDVKAQKGLSPMYIIPRGKWGCGHIHFFPSVHLYYHYMNEMLFLKPHSLPPSYHLSFYYSIFLPHLPYHFSFSSFPPLLAHRSQTSLPSHSNDEEDFDLNPGAQNPEHTHSQPHYWAAWEKTQMTSYSSNPTTVQYLSFYMKWRVQFLGS